MMSRLGRQSLEDEGEEAERWRLIAEEYPRRAVSRMTKSLERWRRLSLAIKGRIISSKGTTLELSESLSRSGFGRGMESPFAVGRVGLPFFDSLMTRGDVKERRSRRRKIYKRSEEGNEGFSTAYSSVERTDRESKREKISAHLRTRSGEERAVFSTFES